MLNHVGVTQRLGVECGHTFIKINIFILVIVSAIHPVLIHGAAIQPEVHALDRDSRRAGAHEAVHENSGALASTRRA